MEYAHQINDSGNLIGVSHVPDSPRTGKPAIVFINGGFLHRVGPYRLYTDAARRMEALGFHVLRFDLSGLGDSEQSSLSPSVENQTQQDIAEAVTFMTREYGCTDIITAGLCTGADDSIESALTDTRIKGMLFLDAPGFRTSRFYVNRILHHYSRRLVSRQKWARVVANLKARLSSHQTTLPPQTLDDEHRPLMEASNLIPAVETLARRGVKMHFLFTGGVFQYYNYAGQVFDMFSEIHLHNSVTESYHKDCDHMFLLHRHREAVIDDMLDWVDITFTNERGTTAATSATATADPADNLSDSEKAA